MFRKGVLFIHGFSANYYENEFCINYLQKDPNLDVYTFTLPGHESPIMGSVKYQEWIKRSEDALLDIIDNYHSIYLIGHSMGGVIASYLASKYPHKVKKLILVAPAFDYGSFKQNQKDFLNIFDKKKKELGLSGYDGLLTKIVTVPIKQILEFTKLVKNYRDSIKKVKCDTLILHGTIDNVVPIESSIYAFDNINGNKHFTKLEGVRHQVFLSDKKEIICKYMKDFLKNKYMFELHKKGEL